MCTASTAQAIKNAGTIPAAIDVHGPQMFDLPGATPAMPSSVAANPLRVDSMQRAIRDNEFLAQQSTVVGQLPKPVDTSAIDQFVDQSARKYGVDPNLVKAVMQQESLWLGSTDKAAKAVSPAGARGFMQLMPETAKAMGVTDILDPAQNIDGGTKYLAQQLKRFNGDVKLALAAYNAGPDAVQKYNGVPPYRETQGYVQKILSRYKPAGEAAPATAGTWLDNLQRYRAR